MQDGIIDIINRSYCYEETCESIATKYRYCIFSSKAKDAVMQEKCNRIKEEFIRCKNDSKHINKNNNKNIYI